ncbi:unnamed protein product [Blepharisma stoltei]|uniref:Uncharacterized protein n=1 Tax=Blepharisma stoltei TaxID=1481888 RepID=A0AAU9J184_9CILI|nr:unnamed protein product [Blepharisma stoltei]
MKSDGKNYKLDNDTLDLQIDRLNSTIQSMMIGIQSDKERSFEGYSDFKPRSKRNCTYMMSLESEPDLIASDREWVCDTVQDEEILDNIEGLILNLDRVSMTLEDYRSHEMRAIEELEYENLEENKFRYEIKCSLNDIYKLISDAKQIIDDTETNKVYHGELKFGEISMNVSIEHLDLIIPDKSNLTQEILNHLSVKTLTNQKSISLEQACISQLENEIEELKRKSLIPEDVFDFGKALKNSITETYERSFDDYSASFNSENSLELTKSTLDLFSKTERPAFHLDLQKLKKNEKIKEELEWQINEVQVIKNQYNKKLNQLLQQTDLFQQQANLIKIKTAELEKDISKFNEEKRIFEEKQVKIKDEIKSTFIQHSREPSGEWLRTIKGRHKTEKSYLDLRDSTPDPITDENAQALYEELQKAQALLQGTIPENADSVVIKINRIKTQISNLRSAKALNNFQVHSNSIKNAIHSMEKQFETRDIRKASPAPKMPMISSITPEPISDNTKIFHKLENLDKSPKPLPHDKLINSVSEANLNVKPPIPNPKIIKNSNLAIDSEIENLKKHLRLKEIRLEEKEKEIFDKEMRLHKTWMKQPDANQLIPMVQKELIFIQNLKQNLELKQKEIERDQFLLLKKLDQIKKKEEFLLEKETKIDYEVELKKRELSEKTQAVYQLLTCL